MLHTEDLHNKHLTSKVRTFLGVKDVLVGSYKLKKLFGIRFGLKLG